MALRAQRAIAKSTLFYRNTRISHQESAPRRNTTPWRSLRTNAHSERNGAPTQRVRTFCRAFGVSLKQFAAALKRDPAAHAMNIGGWEPAPISRYHCNRNLSVSATAAQRRKPEPRRTLVSSGFDCPARCNLLRSYHECMLKDRLRGCICVHLQGKAYKLVWFNESANGVYISVGGHKHGAHFSYHADGKTHMRGLPAIPLPDTPLPPIKDLKGCHEVISQYIPLSDDLIKGVGTEFMRKNEAAVAVFLPSDTFATHTTFTLKTYLVSRDAELDLIKLMYDPPAHWQHQRLVVLNTFDLRNFLAHKLGIAIFATRF